MEGYGRIATAAVHGAVTVPITVEVDIHPGLPQVRLIGLPDAEVVEAAQRIRTAFKNSGLPFPSGRLTVNLTPAAIRKRGSGFDLAIALGILVASRQVPPLPEDIWPVGELGLDGSVRPVPTAVNVLAKAESLGVRGCLIAEGNLGEAALVEGCPVYSLRRLVDCVQVPLSSRPFEVVRGCRDTSERLVCTPLFDALEQQGAAKRALTLAVAGSHHLYLNGQPGVGKSMLAEAAVELLPPLNHTAAVTLACLEAVSGEASRVGRRLPPFRQPNLQVTSTRFFGGGARGLPGEVSLAHGGILFLDELPLYRQEIREGLRLVLEQRKVQRVAQGERSALPADCTVIAAQNRCPCGMRSASGDPCSCTAAEIRRYVGRVPEPLRDRFDLTCEFGDVGQTEAVNRVHEETAATVRQTIRKARDLQCHRYAGKWLNSTAPLPELKRVLNVEPAARALLMRAGDRFRLSTRAHYAVLRVARTIADYALAKESASELGPGMDSEPVRLIHVQEALQYRARSSVTGYGLPY